jgi:hypothetical protein
MSRRYLAPQDLTRLLFNDASTLMVQSAVVPPRSSTPPDEADSEEEEEKRRAALFPLRTRESLLRTVKLNNKLRHSHRAQRGSGAPLEQAKERADAGASRARERQVHEAVAALHAQANVLNARVFERKAQAQKVATLRTELHVLSCEIAAVDSLAALGEPATQRATLEEAEVRAGSILIRGTPPSSCVALPRLPLRSKSLRRTARRRASCAC